MSKLMPAFLFMCFVVQSLGIMAYLILGKISLLVIP